MSNTNILKVSYQVQEAGSQVCLIYKDSQVPYSNIKLNGTDITNSVTVTSDKAYYTFNNPGTYEIDYILTGDTIGNNAFAFSNAGPEYIGYIVSIEVPSCVTHIGTTDYAYTFAVGDGATNIILNDGLEYIGGRAFETISTCSAITIPSTVNHIGCNAFYNFDYAEFTFAGSVPPTFNMSENGDLGNPSVIYVPTGSLSDYIVAAPFYESKYQEYTPAPTPTSGSGLTTKDIAAAYIGSDSVAKIYLGSEEVWAASQPGPSAMPLTFEVISGGSIHWSISNTDTTPLTIEYSKDSGQTWTSITSITGTGTTINVVSGDNVLFRGDNKAYAFDTNNYNRFRSTGGCLFNVCGNIMSLVDSTGFTTATTLESAMTFCLLFFGCTGVVDASNLVLPATTLSDNCYRSMFSQCSNLTAAPALAATILTEGCYRGMFTICGNLTTAPDLPASTLAVSCYTSMFNACRSLTTAPELPATALASYCYYSMFAGCTGLTTAPELPATTLANYCYQNMFNGCTSLTTAPELPASTLAPFSYAQMFNRCAQLNNVKCLATDISATNCIGSWLGSVSSTGTFVKHPNATWPSGASGIPKGWTVQDAVL